MSQYIGDLIPLAQVNGWLGLSSTAEESSSSDATIFADGVAEFMEQNYRIYIRDVVLEIGTKQPASRFVFYDPSQRFHSLIDVYSKAHGEKVTLWLATDNPDQALAELRQQVPNVISAGGVVSNLQSEVLMIFRRGKWDLPKGKVEPGEQLAEAAMREVNEETGASSLMVYDKLISTFHTYKELDKFILKETAWFTMLCSDHSALLPQAIEGISEVRWVPKDQLSQYYSLTYSSIQQVFNCLLATNS